MRTAELRKMKAMMSYEVQKATRIKKIHSKTYRRIHKKADKLKNDKVMMVRHSFVFWYNMMIYHSIN